MKLTLLVLSCGSMILINNGLDLLTVESLRKTPSDTIKKNFWSIQKVFGCYRE